MELRDIEYFAVIAEHGHLGRAAEALGLSDTALSKSMRRLEASVNAKLIRRTPKGVSLTAEGGLLLSRVRDLRISLSDISREISDLSHGRSGSLHVGVHPGMIDDLFAPASAALLAQASRCTIHMAVDASDVLLSALQIGSYDLVIAGIPSVPYEGLVHEHLFDDDLVIFASAKNPLTRRSHLTVAGLANEQWVVESAGSALPRVLVENGIREPRIALYATSLAMRDYIVASTNILGASSTRVLKGITNRFDVAEVPIKRFKRIRRVGISYRRNGYFSPVARQLITFLKVAASKIGNTRA